LTVDDWHFEGACPLQGHGTTKGGRPFYFRARGGYWALHLGEPGWSVDTLEWPTPTNDDSEIAQGRDGDQGWMDPDLARRLVELLLTAHWGVD
jgi:hypothetical protein